MRIESGSFVGKEVSTSVVENVSPPWVANKQNFEVGGHLVQTKKRIDNLKKILSVISL